MITFTRTDPGTYDAATDTHTSAATSTITGESVIITRGTLARLQALGLVESKAMTLGFTPTDYSLKAHTTEFVQPADTTVINGLTWTVRDVQPVAPDGFVIYARIIVTIG